MWAFNKSYQYRERSGARFFLHLYLQLIRIIMSFPDKYENQIQWDFSISNKYRNKFRNAQERGIPFELSLQDFIKLYKRRRCYLTNKVLLFANEDKEHPRFATLDRIDNTKGYTMANTRLVCSLVNACKAVFEQKEGLITLEDLVRIGKVIEKHKGSK